MFKIRAYRKTDYLVLLSWWKASGATPSTEDMIPMESTYIGLIGDTAVLCGSIIMTNVKGYCFLDNFVGNPEVTGSARKELGNWGIAYLEKIAKEKGYNRLVAMSSEPRLLKRYGELGFKPKLEMTASIKELK